MSNNSTIRDTFLSNKQPEINYQETDNNIIHFSNENMNDYVSSSPGIYINKEVAYDRFYNKGRKTKKQKLIIGQNFRKLKVKERDQKRKKMIKNKQIENLYFSPEEQQVAFFVVGLYEFRDFVLRCVQLMRPVVLLVKNINFQFVYF